jgi:DivIVA domain-containing protein
MSTPNALVGAIRPFEVRDVRFHATKFREGYDEETVDEFLDRVARDLESRWAAVDAGYERASSMTAPRLFLDAAAVAGQNFPKTKFRQGYRTEDVDALIQRVAESLTRLDAYLRSFRFASS